MDENLQLIIDLIKRMIANNLRHTDYVRVCELEETYRILTTGKGIEKLLQRFVKRESAEEFALRCQITQSITPAIASSVKNPFYKVVRNDRIKKGMKLGNKANEDRVNQMIEGFFGAANSKNKGLNYWLKTRKFNLSFIDPNAWVVVEWKNGGDRTVLPKPYPFEVSSKDALNFEIINDEVQWMFCQKDIKYKTSISPEVPLKPGKKFTYYGKEYTVIFEQVDKVYLNNARIQIPEGSELVKIGSSWFIWTAVKPNIGFAPCFRVGYKSDLETDGRTFVIVWHDAMPYFMKTLKAVSEFDLTISGHVFPQKIQFAPHCQGESKTRKCDKGLVMGTGETCTVCKGTGYLTHSAANDVIYLPFPDDGDFSKVFDLNNLLVYKSPPIELVKFQNEYILQLETKVHETVFNSQMFIKKDNGGTGGTGVKTAFEIDSNMESIYDTLEAYTEKESELYIGIVTVFTILCNERLDTIDIRHAYPSDFKLKTVGMLLSDLATANESQAPSFLRDAINYDIAEITFQGDFIGLQKYKVKRKFFPFNGKAQDEILFLMASEFVSRRDKVLFANFDAIFAELDAEDPQFFVLTDFNIQYQKLEAKILEWSKEIQAEKQTANVGALRFAADGNINDDPENLNNE